MRHYELIFRQTLAKTLSVILFSVLAVGLSAQQLTKDGAGEGFYHSYRIDREVDVPGVIHEIVVKRLGDSLAGVHLFVDGAQARVDAHLGPYLPHELREALQVGRAVHLIGSVETIRGDQVLMARLVIVDGRTTTIRSPRGFLLYPSMELEPPSNDAQKTSSQSRGGRQ